MAVPIASPNIHPRKRSSLDISRDTASSVGMLARLLGLILSGSVLDRETVLVAFVGVSIRSGEEGERGEFDGISLGITTLSVSRRKFDVDELRTEVDAREEDDASCEEHTNPISPSSSMSLETRSYCPKTRMNGPCNEADRSRPCTGRVVQRRVSTEFERHSSARFT